MGEINSRAIISSIIFFYLLVRSSRRIFDVLSLVSAQYASMLEKLEFIAGYNGNPEDDTNNPRVYGCSWCVTSRANSRSLTVTRYYSRFYYFTPCAPKRLFLHTRYSTEEWYQYTRYIIPGTCGIIYVADRVG